MRIIPALLCCVVQLAWPCLVYSRDPLPPTSATWYRYYSAGADALEKNEPELAKRYFFESLNTVEKATKPQTGDNFFVVRLSALEQGITNLYPKDWSKESSDEAKRLKRQTEQVEVLQRIAALNQRLIQPTDILVGKSKERYQKAREALDKALAEAERKKAAP